MGRKKKIQEEILPEFRQIEVLPISQATEEAIINAASYIDNHRVLASVYDGCKPSYRRLIWSALQFPKGQLQPSVQLVSKVSCYHPHSTDSMKFLLGSMVRTGIFTGVGAFGMTSIQGEVREPGALRYTKSCLSDLYYDALMPLLQCIPRVESPVGPEEIPYIPLPFPLALSFKGLVSGIGLGISTVYPNFSPKSLYLAYVNNDPNLLEPNVNLILDKQNSELKKLWETGKGRVIYSYKLTRHTMEDGKQGYLFEGDTEIFTPSLRKINKYVESGHVFIEDLTDVHGPKMFVGLVSNRGLSLQDLETLCRQCCYDSTVYNLNVTDGKTAFRIPLKDWLDFTYKNYIDLLQQVNVRKIDKVKFDISVQEALPIIADYILNKNPKATDKEICNVFGMPEEIVEAVMSKPISQLRKNKDNSARIKALKDKLKELKKFNPVTYVEDLVGKL